MLAVLAISSSPPRLSPRGLIPLLSAQPFWTILIESMLYKKLQHTAVYFVVVVMVIGAALSAVSSFDEELW